MTTNSAHDDDNDDNNGSNGDHHNDDPSSLMMVTMFNRSTTSDHVDYRHHDGGDVATQQPSSSSSSPFHVEYMTNVDKLGPVEMDHSVPLGYLGNIGFNDEVLDHRSSSSNSSNENNDTHAPVSPTTFTRTLQGQFERATSIQEQNGLLRRLIEEQDKQNNEIEELKNMVSSLTEQLSRMLQ